MARESQWIGEDAAKARTALDAGDVATVQACLEAIEFHALQIGYVPAEGADEGDTEAADDES
jgi:hypothetical protein